MEYKRGKHFNYGRFDTELKCNAGSKLPCLFFSFKMFLFSPPLSHTACNFGSHLDATECSETTECSDWNCLGCREDWVKADEKRSHGNDVPWSVCYKLEASGFGETECLAIEDDEVVWTSVTSESDDVCIIHKHRDQSECVGDGYIWGNCESMDMSQCGENGSPFPADGIAEHLLVCAASGNAKCRTQESCEDAGWCDGGLRPSYWYKASGDDSEMEDFKPSVCIVPAKVERE